MRVLVDILHPAHVHFFRNFYYGMIEKGNEVLFTARDKECVIELLDEYAIPHTILSKQKKGALHLGFELLKRTYSLLKIARKYNPDFLTGIMGPSISLVGRVLGTKSVVFYDTEMAKITNWFAYPLAYAVCTPDCYSGSVRGNHVTYPGYHELAYLHPDRFKPDISVLKKIGINKGDKYFVIRFVSWQASHDLAEIGITLENKYRIVRQLEKYGIVFISSESALPDDLRGYVPDIKASEMHHLLAFAHLLVGESATMASECAVLGVPSVYIARSSRGYIDDQRDKYGLVSIFNHTKQADAIGQIDNLLRDDDLGTRSKVAREHLLRDKIDVTAWMYSFFYRRYNQEHGRCK